MVVFDRITKTWGRETYITATVALLVKFTEACWESGRNQKFI